MRRTVAGLALLALLPACGGEPGLPDRAARADASRQPAELQVGAARIHASLAPTATLNATVAARYGISPARSAQLLLVGVRQGPLHQETAIPARVTARARDLRGVWQDVPLREVREDGFIDYVGTVRATPPDTLTVEITVRREGAESPDLLRFDRDIFPL